MRIEELRAATPQTGAQRRTLETNRVIWSEKTYRIFGLAPQDGSFDIAIVSEMFHPDDREAVFRTAEKAIRSGTCADCEHRLIHPDGETRFVHNLGDLKKIQPHRREQRFHAAAMASSTILFPRFVLGLSISGPISLLESEAGPTFTTFGSWLETGRRSYSGSAKLYSTPPAEIAMNCLPSTA
jgi:hypothetical protein